MRSLKPLSSLCAAALLIGMSLAPAIASARSAAPACDPSFGADATAAFNGTTAALKASTANISTFATAGINVAKVRQEYEPMIVPAECESIRSGIVQIARLDEDILFIDIVNRVDATNSARYVDFVRNTWSPRFQTFVSSLSAPATPEAVATDSPTAESASDICADKQFQLQYTKDILNLTPPLGKDASVIGSATLSLMMLRYQYEDLTPPAGCELGRTDLLQFLSHVEDQALMRLAALGDPTNASTYNDFLNNVLATEEAPMIHKLEADMGMAVTPEATEAS